MLLQHRFYVRGKIYWDSRLVEQSVDMNKPSGTSIMCSVSKYRTANQSQCTNLKSNLFKLGRKMDVM